MDLSPQLGLTAPPFVVDAHRSGGLADTGRCVVVCESSRARAALVAFPGSVSPLDLSACDEATLQTVLAEVRAAQRCLEGLAIRIASRSNELSVLGRAAPAAETMRGDGSVAAHQARREAARADLAAEVPSVEQAVVSGEISGAHVDSIARHRTRLSEEQRADLDLGPLIDRAMRLPVETFDRLVKRQVDKVITDHGLADTVSKQAASEFRHWFDRDLGMGRFAGALDPERYEALINAIDHRAAALAAAAGTAVQRNRNLAAEALVGLVTAASPDGAQDARSRLPSLLVVVDHKTATSGPHPGSICQTEQGHDLAPESLARLCCDATLRKVTLDGQNVPIDVGRRHRTATDRQWAALKTMHSACAWAGCTAPISWCQAHHIHEWEHGGRTDLCNLVPLCSSHHHRVHEGQWRLTLLPDRSLKIWKPDGSLHKTVPTPMRC